MFQGAKIRKFLGLEIFFVSLQSENEKKNVMQRIVRYAVLAVIAIVDPVLAMGQGARNDVKMTLLSLGSGSTRISYERALDEKHSAELTVGLVGAGVDVLNHAQPEGYLLKACYKWNVLPMRVAQSALAGLYVKPELIWADFGYSHDGVHGHTHQVALLAEGGYQVVWKWFVFDVYCGVGPTVGTGNADNYYHGFMRFPKDGFVGWTAGFRLGYAW